MSLRSVGRVLSRMTKVQALATGSILWSHHDVGL